MIVMMLVSIVVYDNDSVIINVASGGVKSGNVKMYVTKGGGQWLR